MPRIIWPVCFLIALAGFANAQRLPRSAVPEHYQIKFQPDFQSGKFTGEETIHIRVLEPTSSITLNAVEIELQDVSIFSVKTTKNATVTVNPKQETATLAVENRLASGPAEVRIRFTGTLNNRLRGFYRSQANHRQYAITQFEPTDARRAFPCFDEPDLKATFSLSVVADRGDTAISNGKVISDTPGPGQGKHTIQFSTTPKMSSYVVALAVGDFQCLEGSAEGIPIRVCATPDKKDLGRFALETAERILPFYNRYFEIQYPFEKLDLVAAPDFEAGAMENTAAITFREAALLIDNHNASVHARQAVTAVLAHEMAHMWFGDLVTMKWWDNVWLNEGFATWMAPKPVRVWKPEWDSEMDEAQSAGYALEADSLNSTRAIRDPAETSAEINQMFDAIAYEKTAAVLRMLEAFVGKDVFRAGVNAYLKKHAYGNATAEDFWDALTQVSKRPVNQMMRTFVDQPGAPLVTAETQCEGNTTSVSLHQRRYFFDRARFDAGSDELWQVPVCMRWQESSEGPNAAHCELLTRKQQTFKLQGCTPWIFLNANARGYYRSAYDTEIRQKLAQAEEEKLVPVERITLLNDEWSMVRIGRDSIGDFLSLAEGLKKDRTRAVMQTLAGYIVQVGDYLVNDSDKEPYRAWVRNLLRPAVEELGWQPAPNESDEFRSLRATVLGALGYAGRDPEVLARSRALAERYVEDPSSVDPTLAGTVIGLAALNGDRKLYDNFLAHTKTAKSPEEYDRCLFALAAFSDLALLKRTLEFALSPEVRNQDMPGVIGAVAGNPAGRELAWSFLKTHWPELQKKMSIFGGPGIIGSTGSFCDSKNRDEVKQFFTQNKVEAGERALRQALESIDYCVDLKLQQESNLASWLLKWNAHTGQ